MYTVVCIPNGQLNSVSLYVKHIPDLYVVDYDEHHPDCELFGFLNDDCTAYTNTTKGSHYYIKIKNMPKFSNQQRVNIDDTVDMHGFDQDQ